MKQTQKKEEEMRQKRMRENAVEGRVHLVREVSKKIKFVVC